MNYTLQDLLQSQLIPDVKILTESMDYSQKNISDISVQELPIDGFIQKDELILSTAVGYTQNPAVFMELIQSAKLAQATAIIFTFKNDAMEIPRQTIEYANQIALPLLVIPWKYRFSTVQKTILTAIEENKLLIFKKLQHTLFNLFFEEQSLEIAANTISETLMIPVKITDTFDTMVTKTTRSENIDGMSPANNPYKVKIKISGAFFGYLYLYNVFSDNSLLNKEEIIEEYITFPLSLWFNRKNIENITTMHLKNNFVYNLANGTYTSFAEVTQQGLYLKFNLSLSYTCIAMRVNLIHDIPKTQIYSKKISENLSIIERILIQEGKDCHTKIMVGNLNLNFIIYIENKPTNPIKNIHTYIDNAEIKIKKSFPAFSFYWGISETSTEIQNFNTLYKHAFLALQYCLHKKNNQYRFTYKDTKKALIISVLSNNPDIKNNAAETLKKLLCYDSKSGIALFDTLTEYMKTNYNISKTARNLHIHRQSLLYRLEKIENLTGMSLNNHDDLFVLESFARIYGDF